VPELIPFIAQIQKTSRMMRYFGIFLGHPLRE